MREVDSTGRGAPSVYLLLVAAVGVIVAAWIVVTPPAGGPDEPAHLVRSAALARGDVVGELLPDVNDPEETVRVFVVPRWLLIDTPCFALEEEQPATCAPPLDDSGGTIRLATSAWDYPVWGHLLPGLGTHVPGTSAALAVTRALSAVVPVLLVAFALLAARSRPLLAAGGLVALTPMAWFTFAVVNPSAPSIAGGFALWVGLLMRDRVGSASWLSALGWAALVLPRRDGLIWACTILVIWAVLEHEPLIAWWRRLGGGPQAVVATSSLATLVWAATSDSRVSRGLLVVPFAVVVVEVARWCWRRATTPPQRNAVVGVGGLVVIALAALTLLALPGGADISLAMRIVNDTGRNLFEAIGLMGWLDTPLPLSAVFLYVAALGALAGLAIGRGGARLVGAAAAVLAAGIVASWTMELFSGNTSGTYWQGRYFLPLLVGIPLLLGSVDVEAGAARRIAPWFAAIAAVVVNAGFLASARRWAVGTNGSVWPWDWHTYGALVHPLVLGIVHAAAWVALLAIVLGGAPNRSMASARATATSPAQPPASSLPSAPASTP